MTKTYAIDVPIYATVRIRAESPQAALERVKAMHLHEIGIEGDDAENESWTKVGAIYTRTWPSSDVFDPTQPVTLADVREDEEGEEDEDDLEFDEPHALGCPALTGHPCRCEVSDKSRHGA